MFESIETRRFNRICSILALLFLIVTIGAKTAWYEHKGLPQWQDFPQYYMGGVVALHGAWDSMYPIPVPGRSVNPGFVGDSVLRPGYRDLTHRVGVTEESVRYMQPPPLTLVLIPLALLPLKACWYAWEILLVLGTWAIGHQAAKVHALLANTQSKAQGALVLLICCSPQAHRWIRVSNCSVVIGWLIGAAVLELIRRRDGIRGALILTLGIWAKYALLVLGPLCLAMRMWRTIAWTIVLVAGLGLLSLAIMGTGPFRVFFTDIAPLLGRTSTREDNQALYPMLLRWHGLTQDSPLPHGTNISFHVAEFICLAIALAMVCLSPKKRWLHRPNIAAGAGMLIGWMLIFTPIFWEHYQPYLTPFWGWLVWEARFSRARAAFATAAIIAGLAPLPLFTQQLFHIQHIPEPLNTTMLLGPLVIYGMGLVRLLNPARDAEDSAETASADFPTTLTAAAGQM
jgi:hypothetical protein